MNETWKDEAPYPRYQKKLLQDLAVLEDLKEEGTIIILLCAFLEKSTNDYKKAIAVAQKRLKWLDDD